jgi:hypothetical protein
VWGSGDDRVRSRRPRGVLGAEEGREGDASQIRRELGQLDGAAVAELVLDDVPDAGGPLPPSGFDPNGCDPPASAHVAPHPPSHRLTAAPPRPPYTPARTYFAPSLDMGSCIVYKGNYVSAPHKGCGMK